LRVRQEKKRSPLIVVIGQTRNQTIGAFIYR